MEKRIFYNYSLILKNLVQYLPSRGIIILNSFLIIPLFTHILNAKEVSIYLVALQILNLICTCSFDWIAKSVLRFYEKYNLQNKSEIFFSTVFWISVFVYIFVSALYLMCKGVLLTKFSVTDSVFFLTVLLVIPCGLRQILYSILRIKNHYGLYTLSIILYQFIFIAAFLGIVNILPNATSIILAMSFAVFCIDLVVMYSIRFAFPISFVVDKDIIIEIFKYSLPLIITNVCYWFVFHSARLIFQFLNQYLNTSVMGVAWSLASNTITPIAGLFMFVNFPVIIKNFERRKYIKTYFTNVIQFYLHLLFPIIGVFCFFSKDITQMILPESYGAVAILLPFFAITIFLHELMKLINIKYHLKIKTYIEMSFSILIVFLTSFLNVFMIPKYSITGAAAVMLLTEFCLIVVNMFIKFRDTDYINHFAILKTFGIVFLVTFVCYLFSKSIFVYDGVSVNLLKLIVFLLMNYAVYYLLRKKILT